MKVFGIVLRHSHNSSEFGKYLTVSHAVTEYHLYAPKGISDKCSMYTPLSPPVYWLQAIETGALPMRRYLKSKRAVLAAGLAALAVAAAAVAYWTAGGSGTGSGATGDVAAITVNQTSSISGLYPGGPSKSLAGTFTNTVNDGPVYIDHVTAAVTAVQGSDPDNTKPPCAPADFEIDDNISSPSPIGQVTTGTGVGAWSGLSVRMLNGANNQDNCKNRTITITYTAHAAP
jgi:hypothetical protein